MNGKKIHIIILLTISLSLIVNALQNESMNGMEKSNVTDENVLELRPFYQRFLLTLPAAPQIWSAISPTFRAEYERNVRGLGELAGYEGEELTVLVKESRRASMIFALGEILIALIFLVPLFKIYLKYRKGVKRSTVGYVIEIICVFFVLLILLYVINSISRYYMGM